MSLQCIGRTVISLKSVTVSLGLVFGLAGCSGDPNTFSLLSETDAFQQSQSSINTKIDILWVIDNSGSMQTSQQQLAGNFNAFISGFVNKGYDYRMAVTTTAAYRSSFTGNQNDSKFRDGVGANRTGVFVIDPTTPNITQTFITNMLQGTSGTGDERAFQSIKATLDSSANAEFGFPRANAFLSVIIVSDEEDFSHNGSNINESYSNPGLHTVTSYVDYLTTKTGAINKFSVSAIAIWDNTCKTQLEGDGWLGRKIATRYSQLVDATRGIKASLCSNFATSLQTITSNIFQLATSFQLSRIPVPETITIAVNNSLIPACYVDTATGSPTPLASASTVNNPAGCGYIYTESNNTVSFVGNYVPVQGANVRVGYDPKYYGQ